LVVGGVGDGGYPSSGAGIGGTVPKNAGTAGTGGNVDQGELEEMTIILDLEEVVRNTKLLSLMAVIHAPVPPRSCTIPCWRQPFNLLVPASSCHLPSDRSKTISLIMNSAKDMLCNEWVSILYV
jgi:hypothetical protein